MPIVKHAKRLPTWVELTRLFGLTIVIVLFVLFAVSMFDRSVRFDRPVAAIFLGIGTAMCGIVPTGYRLALLRSSSDPPGRSD